MPNPCCASSSTRSRLYPAGRQRTAPLAPQKFRDRNINRHYLADYPILGDAKPVLRQFIDAVKALSGGKTKDGASVAAEIKKGKEEWMGARMPKAPVH